MMKLRSKRFCRSISKVGGGGGGGGGGGNPGATTIGGTEIKWELRPGGMLVQKREIQQNEETMISIRVSTVSQWHDISLQSTSTFGELKIILSILTKLEPQEQRLLFKGKEREDEEHLHMVGVRDKDKVLMLEDPALKERKLLRSDRTRLIEPVFRTISV